MNPYERERERTPVNGIRPISHIFPQINGGRVLTYGRRSPYRGSQRPLVCNNLRFIISNNIFDFV